MLQKFNLKYAAAAVGVVWFNVSLDPF